MEHPRDGWRRASWLLVLDASQRSRERRVSDPSTARDLIEAGLAPPPPEDTSVMRRALRRLALRAGRAQARHQQRINRKLLGLLEDLSRGIDELRLWLEELQRRAAATERGIRDLQQWNHELGDHVTSFERRLGPLEALAADIRAVPDPAGLGFERFTVEGAGIVFGYQNAPPPVSPRDNYVAFEDVFRLSEDVIRERQRPYLSLLGGREPVLDAGCGRGEFLELLRIMGVPARGVDLDPGMVARSRAKGLTVDHDDAVAYLERLPDNSLGVVFAAQVVEHLSYAHLVAFLRLASRKLQHGGLLIAETVNPHAPRALKNFWLDLTHRHPIFPEVLLTMCRGTGFASAYIFHPGGSGNVDVDRERCGDYAVVAERASSEVLAQNGDLENSMHDRTGLSDVCD
jgi:2-polyprenyl-3-methyl-5-hydroxy-6-metoxy-1,4-benzoquinol methylase